ncbi:MAG: hypothetical protein CR968_05225 [Flavobacteriia bacterium]|nr:MAG: hypothetical protein CR968_05225 [Flavobacteriia bacterium]
MTNKILLFLLFTFMFHGLFGKPSSQQLNKKEREAITMDFMDKTFIGKVGFVCVETPDPDLSMGSEIFLKISVGQEYITLLPVEVETTTYKDDKTIQKRYGNAQNFSYNIVQGKIIVDNTNVKEPSDYKLLELAFINGKIIGQVRSFGQIKKVVFWQDLTSIGKGEIQALISRFTFGSGGDGFVYMKLSFDTDSISVSTGDKVPPCGTIGYGKGEKYPFTQQENLLIVHYPKSQKSEQHYRLKYLFLKDGELYGTLELHHDKTKNVKFRN